MPAETYGILLVSFSKHSHQQHFIPLYQAHPRLRIIGVADYPDIDPDLRAYNQQWASQLGVPYSEDLDESIDDPWGHRYRQRRLRDRAAVRAHRPRRRGRQAPVDRQISRGYYRRVRGRRRRRRVRRRPGDHPRLRLRHPRPAHPPSPRQRRLRHPARRSRRCDVRQGLAAPDHPTPRLCRPNGRWKYPDIKRELLTVGAYAVGLIQECLGPIRHVVGHAGAFFFPEHGAHGCDDFGTLTLTDADGRVATLCGGRIGTASHPQGGPSRADLIGTRQSATIDAKRPALDAYLRDYSTGYDYRPNPQDPMQWHGGPPIPTAALSDDTAGLAAGLDDLVAALDDDRPTRYGVRQARDLMELSSLATALSSATQPLTCRWRKSHSVNAILRPSADNFITDLG